jgi:hypothetical protein
VAEYLFEKKRQLVCLMQGDKKIINCLEPHPYGTILATSGIEKDINVGTQKCRIFIHLSLHYSLHFIAQLNLRHIIFINTFGFHIIIFHFIHFSIKSEFMIKY